MASRAPLFALASWLLARQDMQSLPTSMRARRGQERRRAAYEAHEKAHTLRYLGVCAAAVLSGGRARAPGTAASRAGKVVKFRRAAAIDRFTVRGSEPGQLSNIAGIAK